MRHPGWLRFSYTQKVSLYYSHVIDGLVGSTSVARLLTRMHPKRAPRL